jgi:dTDP-4-dehydrorhamnose 3,5-epimerase-like enzyme
MNKDLWRGVEEQAAKALITRDYGAPSLRERLATIGVDAGEITQVAHDKLDWITGVEIFPRHIHAQRHRGLFGEFARENEGLLGKLQLWPTQWSAARMFAGTAKGFHVHPPFVPSGQKAADWIRRHEATYNREQWDVMFFVQGRVEMILRDLRAGLPRRTMRFFIDGDNHRSANNIGLIIPPGVAHALRVEGSEDVIMVYGTSTIFNPEAEGRIASEVESAQLPESWQRFLAE